ncbi:MAG TPA: hypothetical protein VI821_00400 [Candidatus Paceibacterota bacterium]
MADLGIIDRYDPAYSVEAFGLVNFGATCWFNAITQAILSIPALFETIGDIDKSNEFITAFCDLYDLEHKIRDPGALYRALMQYGRGDGTGISLRFGNGQEDAYEGFISMITAFHNAKIESLFKHRYKKLLRCIQCENTSITTHESNVFIIHRNDFPNDARLTDLSEYLLKHMIKISDFHCDKCDGHGALQLEILCRIPSVLVIVDQTKYLNHESLIEWPKSVVVPVPKHEKLMYKIVATVEHSGSLSGGHYWTNAIRGRIDIDKFLRDDYADNAMRLNDTSVTQLPLLDITNTTYMVIYHVVDRFKFLKIKKI